MDSVAEIRRFNRFYTRQLGLLDEHLPASDLSLVEARVVYELATGGEQTAADLCRKLLMDKAHLSRIAGRLRGRGLMQGRASPTHGKHRLLSLTEAGRDVFIALEQGTRSQIEHILAPLDRRTVRGVVTAMRQIETALGTAPRKDHSVRLRRPQPGDIGWVTHRQALLYHREYGWDWSYEGLVAEILSRFVADFDPEREDGWVAEIGGAIAGSVFLMRSDAPDTAKLRLLYVEPNMRGLGVGRRLVACCIDRARQLGYRRLTLWTNSVLLSARRIYQAAGFRLVDEAPHHSFGHDLIGQTWVLDLAD